MAGLQADAVFAWLKVGNTNETKSAVMQDCCDAVESLARHTMIASYVYVDPDADPLVPLDYDDRDPLLNIGLRMQAARLYKRTETPAGMAGSPDTGIVRISRYDPDIELTLAPFIESGIL